MDEIIFEATQGAEFMDELIQRFRAAKKEIFWMEPYLGDLATGIFTELALRVPGVSVRILTSGSKNLEDVCDKFVTPKSNIKIRVNGNVHDRVLFVDNRCWVAGQSVNHAAETRPTYLIEVHDVSKMKRVHEEEWKKGMDVSSAVKQMRASEARPAKSSSKPDSRLTLNDYIVGPTPIVHCKPCGYGVIREFQSLGGWKCPNCGSANNHLF